MADRINRVITKTGDAGNTSLADGKRYPKDHPLIELIGALDEANSFIGLLAARVDDDHRATLEGIQSRLFDIGAAIATGKIKVRWSVLASEIEEKAELLNAHLTPLQEFVLPGGSETIAFAHITRSVIRRAERAYWSARNVLEHLEEAEIGIYLNRLSDYFFIFARTCARENGVAEVIWKPLTA
jgi:cob(I)alamin adenosyltransferase